MRRSLLEDIGLHDRIYEAVERDFRKAVGKGRVDINRVGGWLNRTTQRKTWKLATPRAKQLLREVQPYGTNTQIFERISDDCLFADELLANEEFRRRYDRIMVSLSLEDCQLLDAKVEGRGYAELAAIRGKTPGALKAKASRLCAWIRSQVLDVHENERKEDPEAAE